MNTSTIWGSADPRRRTGVRRLARILLPPVAALAMAYNLVSPVAAANLPVPAADYPRHTRLTYYPTWTNRQFDCNFGWYCDPGDFRPYLHIATEDQLQRMGGWAIWGEWRGDRMGFELYSSVYSDQPSPDDVAWNEHAAALYPP